MCIRDSTQSGLVSFVFGVLPMILLVALYVAMGIFVLVFIIDRFYKGLLGKMCIRDRNEENAKARYEHLLKLKALYE